MAGCATERMPSTSPPGKPRKATTSKRVRRATANEMWNGKIRAHRRRQASVAAILDQTLGELAKSNPDLWERRAYLMLVGLVYERLATNEDEISTEELVTLAKVLAENRRVEARTRESDCTHDSQDRSSERARPLPGHFADIVQQVYGTNVQKPHGTGADNMPAGG